MFYKGAEALLLKGIIITCSSQIKEERTISSIYHLLTGKRSIQTVQDAHIYELDRFYGICKKLNKTRFDQIIHELMKRQLLSSTSASTCKPTSKGMQLLAEKQNHLPFTYFSGLTYHAIDLIFLERLLLLVQVLTNRKMNHSSYIPVIDKPSITSWMKSFYQKIKGNIDGQLASIYQELHLLLGHFTENEAGVFVDRLTGYRNYGMSIHQLADQYQLTEDDVQVLLTGMIHHMLDMIQRDHDQYPLLALIISDLPKGGFITQSADKTYELIKSGYTTKDIVQIRNLKINTIYDHIVEISLYDPAFSIDSYVSQQKQLEIMNAVKQTNSSKLKEIKDKVSDNITYFQIRLALASANHSLQSGDIYE